MGSITNDNLKEEEQNGGSYRTIYVITYRRKWMYLWFKLTWFFANEINFFQVVSGILVVSLSIALAVLLGWHICFILHNKTTVEVNREYYV